MSTINTNIDANADARIDADANADATASAFDPVEYINTPRWQESRYGLSRMRELLHRLGDPHRQLRFVHVAGTNGKGSVCAYTASVLQCAGYRTGLFTSPYIKVFEERIRVNGANIPWDRLTEVTLAVREQAEAMSDHPTEFELMCAVAMLYFAQERCDIVVAEVGLGGRLDATNIIEAPEVSVIVRLGLDHTALLGDTIEAIAGEKCGIIKPGCPVVSYPQDAQGAQDVIARVAAERGCELTVVDFGKLSVRDGVVWERPDGTRVQATSDVRAGGWGEGAVPLRSFAFDGGEFATPLLGSYQSYNAAVAIQTLRVLAERGWRITSEDIRRGIRATVWPGRFEVVGTNPLTIVDGGHNPQGAAAMASTLADIVPGARVTFIIGILADKDYPCMLECVVPYGARFVCVTPCNPRALPAADLAQAIRRIEPGAQTFVAADFDEAARVAYEEAGANGVVVAFGSLYSVDAVSSALAAARK